MCVCVCVCVYVCKHPCLGDSEFVSSILAKIIRFNLEIRFWIYLLHALTS